MASDVAKTINIAVGALFLIGGGGAIAWMAMTDDARINLMSEQCGVGDTHCNAYFVKASCPAGERVGDVGAPSEAEARRLVGASIDGGQCQVAHIQCSNPLMAPAEGKSRTSRGNALTAAVSECWPEPKA